MNILINKTTSLSGGFIVQEKRMVLRFILFSASFKFHRLNQWIFIAKKIL